VVARSASARARWTRHRFSVAGEDAAFPALAVADAHTALVLWIAERDLGGCPCSIRAVVRRHDKWRRIVTLSGPPDNSGDPVGAIKGSGRGVAVWVRPIDQQGIVVQASDYRKAAAAGRP
jgi:hypothetical protein